GGRQPRRPQLPRRRRLRHPTHDRPPPELRLRHPLLPGRGAGPPRRPAGARRGAQPRPRVGGRLGQRGAGQDQHRPRLGEAPGRRRLSWTDHQAQRIDELIDEYRAALHDCLDGLSEEEARASLVPSKTTLLGLVKHATFVEGVWFDQAITGRTYAEIGIPATVDRSFTRAEGDTIEVVQAAYRERWEVS